MIVAALVLVDDARCRTALLPEKSMVFVEAICPANKLALLPSRIVPEPEIADWLQKYESPLMLVS